MPHTARLRKVGGSVMLAIPPALLDALELKPNAAVGLSIEAGGLRVEPSPRPRYSLEALLAEAELQAADPGWVSAPAAGRELI